MNKLLQPFILNIIFGIVLIGVLSVVVVAQPIQPVAMKFTTFNVRDFRQNAVHVNRMGYTLRGKVPNAGKCSGQCFSRIMVLAGESGRWRIPARRASVHR